MATKRVEINFPNCARFVQVYYHHQPVLVLLVLAAEFNRSRFRRELESGLIKVSLNVVTRVELLSSKDAIRMFCKLSR